jgi:hypothetical protein
MQVAEHKIQYEQRLVQWKGQTYGCIITRSPQMADHMAKTCLNRLWKMLSSIDPAYKQGWKITKRGHDGKV